MHPHCKRWGTKVHSTRFVQKCIPKFTQTHSRFHILVGTCCALGGLKDNENRRRSPLRWHTHTHRTPNGQLKKITINTAEPDVSSFLFHNKTWHLYYPQYNSGAIKSFMQLFPNGLLLIKMYTSSSHSGQVTWRAVDDTHWLDHQ